MSSTGVTPAECGLKIMQHPDLKFLRVVANNRMQGAIETDLDYSGSRKETTLFNLSENTLQNNLDVTKRFLISLGCPEHQKECNRHSGNAKIWRGVKNDRILEFLRSMCFTPNQRFFNAIEDFGKWLKERGNNLTGWNVALVGIISEKNGVFNFGNNLSVNKVAHAPYRIVTDDAGNRIVDIKHLLSPSDMVVDLDMENATSILADKLKAFQRSHSPKEALELRRNGGLAITPLLLIYVIDKDSKSTSLVRYDMNAPMDLVGLYTLIPGIPNKDSSVRVTLPPPTDDLIY
ncbi:MAG: hypothetical protein K2K97_05050, partial [Muribaculaceae bacterium]|nr:hypothetical protein [Muribaculaceae bacterium]